ncbi:serine/threonine-protein kinase 11-interacting protein isoform X2 [Nilaparvata lugens]|uniref:serine/threonine-protein kinase 11-interacting protein isoform X2 n=1 Tax=Nilaparvata lugens TaxID=108931 RepID=UPI00193E1C60|nr:serine/threonine-protein kinase 11-interacting protein isoform X2 [Nilaparvata lugens]
MESPGLDDVVLDKLVDLLEDGGLKIFRGETKLTLPVCVLQRINAALHQTDSSSEPIKERLQFLQEFVSRTPKLKVTRSKGLTATVDITRFVNVRYLEMEQIPIHLVKGLQALRPQLEALVCHGCSAGYEGHSATDEANSSDSLFQWNGGGFQCLVEDSGSNSLDIEEVPVWEDLRTVSFSNNDMEVVSPRMFRGTPWLQYLDLSNNRITSKWCLESLDHLRHVNLSYNHLESLPALSEVASRRLDVLILRNNLIDDLAEIWLYKNLRRLDVSHNLLDNFRTFAALRELENLCQLDLEGNPVSYAKSYRLQTCSHLIRNEFTSKLLLDGKPLNTKEKEMLGEIVKYGGLPIRSRTPRRPPTSSEELINGDSSTGSPSRRLSERGGVSRSVSSKKTPKVRVAVIQDADSVETEERQMRIQNKTRTENQAEKQSGSFNIEEYRQGFRSFVQQMAENEETLQSIYGTSIQGLHNTPITVTAEIASGSPFNIEQALLNTTAGSDLFYSPAVGSAADQSSKDFGQCVSPMDTTYESTTDEPATANPTKLRLDTSESASSDRTVRQEASSDGEEKPASVEDSDEEKEEDHENNLLWLVQKVASDGKKDEIFLMLTERELKEKGTESGRVLVKWALSTVLSCVKTSSEPPTIQLTFDTIRRNCTERSYEMEPNDAQILLQRIGKVLESRPLKEMNQLVFRCMKCSAVFSQELKATIHKDNSRRCQTCGSNLVIQVDDDEHLPSQGKSPSETGIEPKLSTSPSQCSIGSAASLDRSSRESPAGGPSSTNAEKEGSHGTSDIEVISNPSQSSIEILEVQARLNAIGGASTTPIRKRSSEERQAIAAVPQLVTVPEVQNVGTGLTESSSSGSLTDSICTTYENHAPLSRRLPSQSSVGGGGGPGGMAPTLTEETSAENSPSTAAAPDSTAPLLCPQPPPSNDNEPLKSFHSLPNTNYASILEDLLQNVSSKLEEPKQLDAAPTDDTVQYSYDCLTNVDHRIKFFMYQSLFKEENEDLLLLIRVTICDEKGQRYPGCFVLSNCNCFILKVVGKEAGDDASEFLQKECTFSNSKLSKVQSLPWFQGASVTFQDSWYLLLTHDVSRTKSFLKAVNDARPCLPEQCVIDSSERSAGGSWEDSNGKMALAIQQQLLTAPSMQGEGDLDAVVRHMSLPVSVAISRDKAPTETISLASFGVTASNIFLLEPEVSWMLASTDVQPTLHRTQLMSNLVDVEKSGTSLELHFLDENEGVEEVWKLSYLTTEAVSNILEAIKSPWETLFSVPLQITNG